MFSGNTDGFDVFDEDNREDFSHLTSSTTPPTTTRRQHAAPALTNGKLTDRQRRDMEVHMQDPDNKNNSDNSQSWTQPQDDVDMDTNTEGLLVKANEIAPTFTDEFEEDLQREVAYAPGLMAATEGENVILSHQVRHQVALPPDWNYTPISQHVPRNPPAKTYPFTLDPFQKLATYSIERGESVLVSAHTSAGKTVVAEFAIATSLQNKQRVIYTSPIKALSNQKYRELLEEFKDVGLMTGDVTINPSASCLVMTTEILRGMLYHGSEVMREVAWVIFDEIHYMRDAERGVVWEETIIMLPAQCHYVFLSATIPNAMEFAEWVCRNKEQPCHVVYTDFRPTPLQHYLFPSGGEGIYLVVDEKGQFREDNFNQALAAIVEGNPKNGKKSKSGPNNHNNKVKGAGKKDMSTDGPSDIYKIVKMIQAKNLYPVIVFSFSKRECEALALQMSNLGFNSDKEGKLVLQVFNNAISSLPECDRTLPQIMHLLPLLQRGIGIHHGGLLPILKEVIEILFQEGLVKVLFATETFSIGLNMPAKAVIFTGVQKFDGEKIRWVSGGEYIQMSGRAGRRGLDDRGVVIMMLDQKMEPAVAQGMVLGTTDPLNSAFYLSYHMILNLMRIEGISPEFMLERCFYQFQTAGNIPRIKQDLLKWQTVVTKIQFTPVEESSLEQYHDLRVQLATCAKEIRSIIYNPQHSLQYLQSGRVVNIAFDKQPVGWGVLTGCHKARPGPGKKAADSADGNKPGASFILDILLAFPRDTKFEYGSGGIVTGIEESQKGKMVAQPTEFAAMKVSLDSVRYIGAPLISLPKDIRTSPGSRANAFRALLELQRRCPDGIPILDPVEDMGIRSPALQRVIRQVETLEELLYKHPMANLQAGNNQAMYEQFLARSEAKAKIRSLKATLSKAVAVTQMTELKDRKRVLRRLEFTTASDVAVVKGRVACEINSGDGLLLTELIFNGTFRELTVEQTVALMSCFCFFEKLDAPPAKLKEVLSVPFKMLQESARAIARVEVECNIPNVDVDVYVQKFKPDMMDVAFAWANGASFEEINTMTDAFEGSIIRMFRLLDELMRQMAAACKSLGNEELEKKFLDGIKSIKRGVIFAASLYLF
ncbi:ATP-dependent RNA helicase mtr4 [Linnemannia hyalina]|uniref:ATP-dependent RNA helicase mtr4 n=1 Tax=Linnemannia hyalina TaxID=64524 RepID=A0A9P8BSL5_9FUNG|nr:ATP-dependent RNA helicase mtr4 [Linnemannia hyalina]